MTQLLRDLMAQLAAVNLQNRTGPEDEVEESDHAVGIMNEDLRRLWVLRSAAHETLVGLRRDALLATLDAKNQKELEDRIKPLEVPFSAACTRMDLVERLFWDSVRYEFPELALKSKVGVRRGWQIVWTDEPESLSIIDILEAMGADRAHLIEVSSRRRGSR